MNELEELISQIKIINLINIDLLGQWITARSVGGYARKSEFNYYQKKLWSNINNLILELQSKEILTINEQYFLNSVVYNGDIFRIQRYFPKHRKHICELKANASWSADVESVSKVYLVGDVLLMRAVAQNAISIRGLIDYLKYCDYNVDFYDRYYGENEIVYPVIVDELISVNVVNKDDLIKSKDINDVKILKTIPRNKLGRNNLR